MTTLPSPQHSATNRKAAARLLVVDDEDSLRGLLEEFFERNGYEVICCSGGQEALDVLLDQPVDAVIADLVMPEMDGIALLTTLSSRHPGLPVVMLTALGFQEDLLIEALRLGAAGFVSKGLPLSQLLMEVHRVLHVPEKLRASHAEEEN